MVCLTWWKDLASKVDYTAFFVGGKLYMLHATNPIIGIKNMVNKEDWVQAIDFVKKQCTEVVVDLISKFKRWFPTQELLNATRIIYPQY